MRLKPCSVAAFDPERECVSYNTSYELAKNFYVDMFIKQSFFD
jgi:hypothetical protein